MKLPLNIQIFIQKNNYVIKEILQYNERKGTYIIKIVSKQNNFFIIKGFNDQASSDIKNKFLVEIAFLIKNKNCDIFPNIIFQSENFFLMEFINGLTAREYFFINKNITFFLQSIEQMYNCLNQYKTQHQLKELYTNNIYRYIYILLLSSPFQLKNIQFTFLEKFRNKSIELFLKIRIKKFIKKNKNLLLKHINFSHNDFHYNNIIISNTSIKYIDFENIKFKGSFEIDIIFLLVLLEGLNINSIQLKNKFISELYKNEFYNEIYTIFKIAIKFNKRFYFKNKKI